MKTITEALSIATHILKPYVPQSHLEAELLLALALQKPRSSLYAYPECSLTPPQIEQFSSLLKRRSSGEPLAYILGEKEFWSLPLHITQDTLVPRPETELLVELVLKTLPAQPQQLADLGTGSGAIALALAKERPAWRLTATDASHQALQVAQQNAKRLEITNLEFLQGDWCAALPAQKYHALISNPPYIAENDPHLADLTFEPKQALVSGASGLDALGKIIQQSPNYLTIGGWIFLEHGCDQAAAVKELLAATGYHNVMTHQDLSGQDRVTAGRQWP